MDMPALLNTIPQIGKVEWIGIRSERKAELTEVEEVEISIEGGLPGDHYSGRSGKRQITLIQAEHLDVVAAIWKKEKIDPQETRRNIVVSGVNLLAFKNKKFRIGEELVLEMTGLCHPCTRMEANLGAGGYNAMRGHGGITARVIHAGRIGIGDEVILEV